MIPSGPKQLSCFCGASHLFRLSAVVFWLLSAAIPFNSRAEELPAAARFREHVQPILEAYCYVCHGYGTSEGGRTLDEFDSDAALVENRELWHAVLKNVRAGIMPPAEEERPNDQQRQQLFDWIKFDVFGIDPQNPDPGRVTLRRLNRVEYRNTIRDLMGVDFDTTNEFPADDAGYGFDNIGDVLSVSPLLLEKYLQAAEQIVERAVPMKPYDVAEKRIDGEEFQSDDGAANGDRMSYYKAATVGRSFRAKKPGTYRIIADLMLDGDFEFDPARCRVAFSVDDKTLHQTEYGWADKESRRFEVDTTLTAGEHRVEFQLEPLVDEQQRLNEMDYRIRSVLIRGPVEHQELVENKNYRRFFPKGAAPEKPEERDAYAREVLAPFARRAYRRPVDDATVDRLVALAKETYTDAGQPFEYGVGRAMVAVLASPRFIFRVEDVRAGSHPEGTRQGAGRVSSNSPPHAPRSQLLDEYALASRLSYLLWSSMPDDELMELADRGELRASLSGQVKRMLKDPKSGALAENFAGQWLRSRDVEHFEIDAIDALGLDDEWDALREQFWKLRGERGRRRDRDRQADADDAKEKSPEERKRDEETERLRAEFRRFRDIREMFSGDLRQAMRRETEMYFEHIVREDRSVLELIDSNYAFLNEELAKHYGVSGVKGRQMRRVELPADSPRGGVLTQGTLLVVTSNPTRTSPVKRGLYILDNILGTPAPPPPANVPPLEAAGAAITDHQPTVRELQEQHRRDPLCSSCHARMDPLGLALENFNAMGMWRDTEHDRPIDASGELLTGEEFNGVRDVKKIIMNERGLDFYRCITEKLLTYALGRGLEYYDEHTVDQIADRLEQEKGKFSALLMGVIESAPFQKQRRAEELAATQ
jgi:hypothetical protein